MRSPIKARVAPLSNALLRLLGEFVAKVLNEYDAGGLSATVRRAAMSGSADDWTGVFLMYAVTWYALGIPLALLTGALTAVMRLAFHTRHSPTWISLSWFVSLTAAFVGSCYFCIAALVRVSTVRGVATLARQSQMIDLIVAALMALLSFVIVWGI